MHRLARTVVTVLLALGSSACYGVSNFVGPLIARRSTVFVVLFVSHVAALVGAAAYLVAVGGAPLPADAFGFAMLAGLGNGLGLIGFYKAAELGPMSVVAPIGATGATVPIVAGLAGGDSLTTAQAAGMLLALGGCVLAARSSGPPTDFYPDPRRSALWSAASALAFGMFLTALPAASEDGRAWALFDARVAVVVIVGIWAGRRLGRVRADAAMALPGLLLFAGTVLYVVAASRGQLSLVSVLGALFPVWTVGLSVVVLAERPSRVQLAGVAAALVGVALIAA